MGGQGERRKGEVREGRRESKEKKEASGKE